MEKSAPLGRNQFLLMVGIAVATLGGSALLFSFAEGGGLWGTVNKGEFVKPRQRVADFDWRTQEAAAFAREFPPAFAPEEGTTETDLTGRESVKRTWWLVLVAGEQCASACRDAVTKMRALQVLLTKDATRVRRALVLQAQMDRELATEFPKMLQLTAAVGTQPAAGIYIVDPFGEFVLRYPFLDSAADVQKDLKRLLKYSQLG